MEEQPNKDELKGRLWMLQTGLFYLGMPFDDDNNLFNIDDDRHYTWQLDSTKVEAMIDDLRKSISAPPNTEAKE